MSTTQVHRSWLEIDLNVIKDNYLRIVKQVAPAEVMAVLKANAYGIGLIQVAEKLESVGLNRIGLASISEALQLKKVTKCHLHLLGGLLPDEIEEAVKIGIVCPISSLDSARQISREAQRQGCITECHVLIDTGMGRLGIPYHDFDLEWEILKSLPNLKISGIYSHFSNANEPEHPQTALQYGRFHRIIEKYQFEALPLIHLANSDGINNFPQTYHKMVRTGINLYGVFDLLGHQAYSLEPSLTLKSKLISCRSLQKGFTIGYGCTYILEQDTLVGTIPIGYADGVPLAASNRGEVMIQGKRCRIIGRVSMDYIMVNLSPCPEAQIGEEVTLIGCQGPEKITVEDWARLKNTHPYDIICSLGARVQRVYLNARSDKNPKGPGIF